MLNKDLKILIVGLGLLGGSYAKKLTAEGYHVKAITRDPKTIEYALENKMIEYGTTELEAELIGEADLIIFALYPKVFIKWIGKNGHMIKPGTVITDVTGVKGSVVEMVQDMVPDGVEFISAHPMAGRESSGITYADDTIFNGANYIVVPTEKNSPEAISLCRELGETLGFEKVSELSVDAHDKMIAFLSQLTHCIAVSLMCASDDPDIVKYTGDSFRDLTRIANINDEMWSELFLLNRDALVQEMDRFRESFDKLYATVRDGKREEMRELMRTSSERRRKFNKK
ncbi:MAG: prephenate dehydrogenase [Clostridia bacterium]|nr:prephenate dehydrogenase [Clostridia bacterium]